MVNPIQSMFAAGLLLTLAFTVNDRSPAAPAPGDATIQLACDHEDNYTVSVTADGSTAVSPCGGPAAR
jgi:hypothetical protein